MFERLKIYLHFLRSLFRLNISLLSGMWRLTKLPQPAITFFGGTKLEPDSSHAQQISEIAKRLALKGFSIITGGGPGIMEAANLGAFETTNHTHIPNEIAEKGGVKIVSMGIGLEGLESSNKYVQESVKMRYFFARKWLLVRYSVGFVVGPGGFGTLDELAEILTLIQTHRMPRTPVVLIGSEYWQPFLDWVNQRALRDRLLKPEDAAIILVTDSVDEAYSLITTRCTGFEACGIDAKPTE